MCARACPIGTVAAIDRGAQGPGGMETERNERWSRWASIATVLAALFAIVTFAWSAKMELDTARAQAQATTLEILQAQMQLAVEHPEYATGDAADPAVLA